MPAPEMRGIGLADQLQEYGAADGQAQEKREKTKHDAMREVRDYGTGAPILHELGVRKLRLLSNHPPRLHAVEGFDLEIIGHVPLTGGQSPDQPGVDGTDGDVGGAHVGGTLAQQPGDLGGGKSRHGPRRPPRTRSGAVPPP